MTDNNVVSFKVYFESGEGSDKKCEVRRFGIESDVATSYSYLAEKLKTVFPCLKNATNIHIYWKDTENDNVRICSDAELIIALTEIEEPIKKLFIKMESSVTNGDNNLTQQNIGASCDDIEWGPDNLHPNITCDGCDGSVSGFRYKCLQCADYDLCSTCEAKAYHPEHFMLRMPTPIIVEAWINDGRKGRGSHQKWHHVVSAAMGGHHSKKHYKKHHHGKHHNPMKLVDSIGDIVSQVMASVGDFIPPQQANTTQESRCPATNNTESSNVKNVTFNIPSTSSAGSANQPSGSGTGLNVNDTNGNIIESLAQNFDSVLTGVLSAVNDIQAGIPNNTRVSNHSTDDKTSGSNDDCNTEKFVDVNSTVKNVLSVIISELSKAQKLCEASQARENTTASGNEKPNPSDSVVNKETASDVAAAAAASIYPTAPESNELLTPEELKKYLMGDEGIRVKAVTNEPVLQQKEAENGWTLLTNEKKEEKPTEEENPTTLVNHTGAIPKTTVNNAIKNEDSSANNATGESFDGNKKSNPSNSGWFMGPY